MTAAAAGTGPLAPVDPTVCSPEELQQIQDHLGVSLKDTSPNVIALIVDRSRHAGNAAFRQKNYREAVQMYSQAIAGAPANHTLYGNRAAAYLALGLYEAAAWDARKALSLCPDWPKGHYRLGCAHLGLSHWGEAARVLQRGAELEPGNADMAAKLGEARRRADAEAAARRAQADTERRGVVARLRAARRADQQLAQLNQFKQSMVGPDWELEDLEWRPTFLPAMKLKPLRAEAVLGDPRKRLLAAYLASLADLAHPKQALRILGDQPRLLAFRHGIAATLEQQPPGAHVLVLGAGGSLLSLMAAQAGAGSVTAVERSRMLYRMAKQCLDSNAAQHGDAVGRVRLVDRRLQGVGVVGEPLPPDALLAEAGVRQQQGVHMQQQRQRQEREQARRDAASSLNGPDARTGAAASPSSMGGFGAAGDSDATAATTVAAVAAAAAAVLLPQRASLLVTDLLDHSVLGMGLLPTLDYAAERLLAPGARVVPQRVQVYGMLLELRVGEVSGFDLSALNAYWWHPAAEALALSRLPHRRLSAPFPVHCLDLQARLDARLAGAAGGAQGHGSNSGGGSHGGGHGDSSRSSDGSGSDGSSEAVEAAAAAWQLDACLEVPVMAEGHWNAVALWFEVHADAASTAVVSSWGEASRSIDRSRSSGASGDGGTAAAPAAGAVVGCAGSWEPAVQYVDGQAVVRGSLVRLRVRQDSGQFVITSHPPQCRPRHALVPRWHYDMVLDRQRNDAYEAAITRAVRRKRSAGCAHLLALDVGAGSGLLSMMAARAGADEVYAAEISQHMCDVGEEACIMNGFLGRITMLDRDARRLDVLRKPDGTPPDLPRRADLLVYEVFDSGCIGEGVLHLVAAAQAKLLAADAAMVPLSARVYCQPIQMRVGSVLGFDCSQANRWRWRPDYEGVELGHCRGDWEPLADPSEVFFFDFQQAAAHMQPEEVALQLPVTQPGVFNAVAMWFDLHLDEETTLSTSPYADKGLTWQQAVQWVEEVAVQPGQVLHLTARHDTYSITYSHTYSEGRGTTAEPGHGRGDTEASAAAVQVEGSARSVTSMAGTAGAASTACLPSTQQVQLQQCQERAPGEPQPTGVPLRDPTWQAAYERLQGLNSQLVKACVQNPLEYRAVAQAALQFASRPHDLGIDAQQATDFCVKMMG